jgi:hypothetical protein
LEKDAQENKGIFAVATLDCM